MAGYKDAGEQIGLDELRQYGTFLDIEAASPLRIAVASPDTDGRIARFLAPVVVAVVDGRGRDHGLSFRNSVQHFMADFRERIEPHISWFPRKTDPITFKVHRWWDSDWSFGFLAEPLWRLHRSYGGPIDLGKVDDLRFDEPIVLIVRAKLIRESPSAN